jgi:glycine cleavage system H protein
MDEFTVVNLFETKGIEYIIIIAFLLLIIPFWILLTRPVKVKLKPGAGSGPLGSSVVSVPQGIYFSKSHTWAHLLKSGEARLGIGSLLVHLTGIANLRMLKEPGSRVTRGERLFEISIGEKSLSVVSPLSGTITSLNPVLREDPSLIHEEPYGRGWICSIKPSDWMTEISGFNVAEGATAWLIKELERIRDFMAGATGRNGNESAGVYLQDGGEPISQMLTTLTPEEWNRFQKEFLE